MLRLSDKLYVDPRSIDGVVFHDDGTARAFPRGVHDPAKTWRLDAQEATSLRAWLDRRSPSPAIHLRDESGDADADVPAPRNLESLREYLGRLIDDLGDLGTPNAAWIAARLEVLRRDAPAGVMWAPTGEVVPIDANGEMLATTE